MRIETERMIVRSFREEDAGDLYEILGDDETMKYCEPAYTFEKTQQFLRDFCIAKKGALAAALKDSGKVIGYILFSPLGDGVCEIGWIFHRGYRRQGYAYESCAAVIGHAFRERNVQKIVAETIDRERSVPLMEKLGMTPESVQKGQAGDLYRYGILCPATV